jgi:hypothetical protein
VVVVVEIEIVMELVVVDWLQLLLAGLEEVVQPA